MRKTDKEQSQSATFGKKLESFGTEVLNTVKFLGDITIDLLPASEKLRKKASSLRESFAAHISYDLYSLKRIKLHICKIFLMTALFITGLFLADDFCETVFFCIFGAFIGLFIGHFLDIWRTPQRFFIYRMTRAEKPLTYAMASSEISMQSFAKAFTGLLAKVAAKDKGISDDEEDLYLSFISASPENEESLRKSFNEAATSSELSEDIMQIGKELSEFTDVYPLLLDLLFSMASADADVGLAEFKLLQHIAQELKISSKVFVSVSSAYYIDETKLTPNRKKDDFEILGLDKNASKGEIRRAWINLVQENHPDRLSGAGADDIRIEAANETLAEINAAYNRLMKF